MSMGVSLSRVGLAADSHLLPAHLGPEGDTALGQGDVGVHIDAVEGGHLIVDGEAHVEKGMTARRPGALAQAHWQRGRA